MQKNKIRFPKMNGKNLKIGIVAARWNAEIVDSLLEGTLKALAECGVSRKNIFITRVPGAFELPLGAQRLIKTKKVQAVVALGCLFKGETMHFEYASEATSYGLMRVGLATGKPVVFGVLPCLNEKQAVARSSGENNHGYGWGMTAVEMALFHSFNPVLI